MLEGVIVGLKDEIPKVKSIVYRVEVSDDQVKECEANAIVQNILTRVESEVFSLTLIESIVDWKKKK